MGFGRKICAHPVTPFTSPPGPDPTGSTRPASGSGVADSCMGFGRKICAHPVTPFTSPPGPDPTGSTHPASGFGVADCCMGLGRKMRACLLAAHARHSATRASHLTARTYRFTARAKAVACRRGAWDPACASAANCPAARPLGGRPAASRLLHGVAVAFAETARPNGRPATPNAAGTSTIIPLMTSGGCRWREATCAAAPAEMRLTVYVIYTNYAADASSVGGTRHFARWADMATGVLKGDNAP
jgi:hypothetical protein